MFRENAKIACVSPLGKHTDKYCVTNFQPVRNLGKIVKDFLINKMQHSQPANIGPQYVP